MNSCPNCGSSEIDSRRPSRYRYRESGLDNVWLEGGGVLETRCRNCGRRFVAILKEQQLLQVIALGLLMRPGFLRGSEIRYLRKMCRLTQAELADRLLIDRRQTITEWEDQEEPTRSEQTEYSLRAVLLDAFSGALSDEGNNHLARFHRKTLAAFQAAFPAAYRRYFTTRARKVLRLRKRRDWLGPDLAAA